MGWFGNSKKKGVIRGKITIPKPKKAKPKEFGHDVKKNIQKKRKMLEELMRY